MAVYFGVLTVIGCAPNRSPYGPFSYAPWTQPGYPQPGTPVGYAPGRSPGTLPISWGPGTPVVISPPNNPFPIQPQPPGTPVVLHPVPPTNPNPPGTPTTPVTNPSTPTPPPVDRTANWAPWPLPPFQAAVAVNRPAPYEPSSGAQQSVHPASSEAGAESDLRYRGGRTLPQLKYVNLYVGGESAGWKIDEVQKIEVSLNAAMNDANLNHVLQQYFPSQTISSVAHFPHPLVGYKPAVVSRGDIQHYLEYLLSQGYLSQYDLGTTVFNFLLPQGTILNDHDQPENSGLTSHPGTGPTDSDSADSRSGLGGYHGSVHAQNKTVYFSVVPYAERRPDGSVNGVPVLSEPWKNICAAMYHQLCETRTDPDVEDALRSPNDPASVQFLGWTTDQGEEIGDLPLKSGTTLHDSIQEVPLANGQGTVPVQLMYSNAIHAAEGPIQQPH